MDNSLESVMAFIDNVEISEPRMRDDGLFESGRLESNAENAEQPAAEVPPPVYEDKPQAVAVGSQIAEFASGVPAEIRPAISNSLLLAQLAANKAIETTGGTVEWYNKYVQVLSSTGWLVEGDATSFRSVSGSSIEVSKEIIPFITAALVPAGPAAASVLIVKLLEGLNQMNKDAPWITLFDRESQRASANQFQLGYVSAGEGGQPRLMLVCFALDAQHSITQVLFFKFSHADATLSHSQADLSINQDVLLKTDIKVKTLLHDHIDDYISGIDI